MASGSGRRPASSAGEAPPSRRDLVLAVIRESLAPLSVTEVAERLDIHPNTVRFHLDALLAAGAVERGSGERAGPGRPPVVYAARPGMDPAGPRNYRLLAEILTGHLAATAPDPAKAATDAGRAWGAFLAPPPVPFQEVTEEQAVGGLVTLLDGLGFRPETRSGEPPHAGRPRSDSHVSAGQPRLAGGTTHIGLRHCPFLELVDTRAQIVCPLHLGLMQGAMAAMGAPLTATRLEPFAEPDLCLAHLGPVPGDHPARPGPGPGMDRPGTPQGHTGSQGRVET
nr:helix-turn-helix domain-containing protein [Sphaerisporangium perillae]